MTDQAMRDDYDILLLKTFGPDLVRRTPGVGYDVSGAVLRKTIAGVRAAGPVFAEAISKVGLIAEEIGKTFGDLLNQLTKKTQNDFEKRA